MSLIDKGTPQRQLGLYAPGSKILKERLVKLLQDTDDPSLQLSAMENKTLSVVAFEQGNVAASRKKLMPIVQRFLEEVEKDADLVNEVLQQHPDTAGSSSAVVDLLVGDVVSMMNPAGGQFQTSLSTNQNNSNRDDDDPFGLGSLSSPDASSNMMSGQMMNSDDPFGLVSLSSTTDQTVSDLGTQKAVSDDPFGLGSLSSVDQTASDGTQSAVSDDTFGFGSLPSPNQTTTNNANPFGVFSDLDQKNGNTDDPFGMGLGSSLDLPPVQNGITEDPFGLGSPPSQTSMPLENANIDDDPFGLGTSTTVNSPIQNVNSDDPFGLGTSTSTNLTSEAVQSATADDPFGLGSLSSPSLTPSQQGTSIIDDPFGFGDLNTLSHSTSTDINAMQATSSSSLLAIDLPESSIASKTGPGPPTTLLDLDPSGESLDTGVGMEVASAPSLLDLDPFGSVDTLESGDMQSPDALSDSTSSNSSPQKPSSLLDLFGGGMADSSSNISASPLTSDLFEPMILPLTTATAQVVSVSSKNPLEEDRNDNDLFGLSSSSNCGLVLSADILINDQNDLQSAIIVPKENGVHENEPDVDFFKMDSNSFPTDVSNGTDTGLLVEDDNVDLLDNAISLKSHQYHMQDGVDIIGTPMEEVEDPFVFDDGNSNILPNASSLKSIPRTPSNSVTDGDGILSSFEDNDIDRQALAYKVEELHRTKSSHEEEDDCDVVASGITNIVPHASLKSIPRTPSNSVADGDGLLSSFEGTDLDRQALADKVEELHRTKSTHEEEDDCDVVVSGDTNILPHVSLKSIPRTPSNSVADGLLSSFDGNNLDRQALADKVEELHRTKSTHDMEDDDCDVVVSGNTSQGFITREESFSSFGDDERTSSPSSDTISDDVSNSSSGESYTVNDENRGLDQFAITEIQEADEEDEEEEEEVFEMSKDVEDREDGSDDGQEGEDADVDEEASGDKQADDDLDVAAETQNEILDDAEDVSADDVEEDEDISKASKDADVVEDEGSNKKQADDDLYEAAELQNETLDDAEDVSADDVEEKAEISGASKDADDDSKDVREGPVEEVAPEQATKECVSEDTYPIPEFVPENDAEKTPEENVADDEPRIIPDDASFPDVSTEVQDYVSTIVQMSSFVYKNEATSVDEEEVPSGVGDESLGGDEENVELKIQDEASLENSTVDIADPTEGMTDVLIPDGLENVEPLVGDEENVESKSQDKAKLENSTVDIAVPTEGNTDILIPDGLEHIDPLGDDEENVESKRGNEAILENKAVDIAAGSIEGHADVLIPDVLENGEDEIVQNEEVPDDLENSGEEIVQNEVVIGTTDLVHGHDDRLVDEVHDYVDTVVQTAAFAYKEESSRERETEHFPTQDGEDRRSSEMSIPDPATGHSVEEDINVNKPDSAIITPSRDDELENQENNLPNVEEQWKSGHKIQDDLVSLTLEQSTQSIIDEPCGDVDQAKEIVPVGETSADDLSLDVEDGSCVTVVTETDLSNECLSSPPDELRNDRVAAAEDGDVGCVVGGEEVVNESVLSDELHYANNHMENTKEQDGGGEEEKVDEEVMREEVKGYIDSVVRVACFAYQDQVEAENLNMAESNIEEELERMVETDSMRPEGDSVTVNADPDFTISEEVVQTEESESRKSFSPEERDGIDENIVTPSDGAMTEAIISPTESTSTEASILADEKAATVETYQIVPIEGAVTETIASPTESAITESSVFADEKAATVETDQIVPIEGAVTETVISPMESTVTETQIPAEEIVETDLISPSEGSITEAVVSVSESAITESPPIGGSMTETSESAILESSPTEGSAATDIPVVSVAADTTMAGVVIPSVAAQTTTIHTTSATIDQSIAATDAEGTVALDVSDSVPQNMDASATFDDETFPSFDNVAPLETSTPAAARPDTLLLNGGDTPREGRTMIHPTYSGGNQGFSNSKAGTPASLLSDDGGSIHSVTTLDAVNMFPITPSPGSLSDYDSDYRDADSLEGGEFGGRPSTKRLVSVDSTMAKDIGGDWTGETEILEAAAERHRQVSLC